MTALTRHLGNWLFDEHGFRLDNVLRFLLGVLLTVASVAAVAYAGYSAGVRSVPVAEPAPVVDASGEYYRGVFDFCSFVSQGFVGMPQAEAIVTCNDYVADLRLSGWYEQPSEGYRP